MYATYVFDLKWITANRIRWNLTSVHKILWKFFWDQSFCGCHHPVDSAEFLSFFECTKKRFSSLSSHFSNHLDQMSFNRFKHQFLLAIYTAFTTSVMNSNQMTLTNSLQACLQVTYNSWFRERGQIWFLFDLKSIDGALRPQTPAV